MWDDLSRKQEEMDMRTWRRGVGGSSVERLSDSPKETSRVESPMHSVPTGNTQGNE